MAKSQVLICPYCGSTQPAGERCGACAGFFEPLSRQATHNAMGPWFVRSEARPYQPGCSYQTLVTLIERGQITKYTIIRGPTTKQFWTVARHVPGVAHLLGFCHNCDTDVHIDDHGCPKCGVPFGAYLDRNYLGLPDVQPLPWEAPNDAGAPAASRTPNDISHPARSDSLSSFATDDELLRDEESRHSDLGNAEAILTDRSMTTSVPRAAAVSPVVPAPSTESYAAGSAARAMQRRLSHQERTIKRLIIVLLVTVASAIIGTLTLVSRLGAETNTTPPTIVEDSVPIESNEPAEEQSPSNTAQGDVGEVPEDASGTSTTNEPVDPDIPPVIADYRRALSLAAAGDDSNRAVDERLEDYTSSLTILRTLRDTHPVEALPDAIDEQIAAIEQRHKRLKLNEEFYGDPPRDA